MEYNFHKRIMGHTQVRALMGNGSAAEGPAVANRPAVNLPAPYHQNL